MARRRQSLLYDVIDARSGYRDHRFALTHRFDQHNLEFQTFADESNVLGVIERIQQHYSLYGFMMTGCSDLRGRVKRQTSDLED